MGEMINWLASGGLWAKIYIGYACLVGFLVVTFLWQHVVSNPKKKLNFITNANKDGRIAVGKLTCLTLHGNGKPEHYQAEYMYVVEGKRYFVTYQMAYSVPMDNRKDMMNADMLLLKLKGAMILFYAKNKPSKVMSKLEVFASEDGIHQIRTPKSNAWRDTTREWVSPVDLVSYGVR